MKQKFLLHNFDLSGVILRPIGSLREVIIQNYYSNCTLGPKKTSILIRGEGLEPPRAHLLCWGRGRGLKNKAGPGPGKNLLNTFCFHTFFCKFSLNFGIKTNFSLMKLLKKTKNLCAYLSGKS